jgi:branched-chain amino acid transport system permease protein
MTMYMVIGGLGTVLGPLLGALMVPWLTQYLQSLQEYRFLIFGPVLIFLVIFVPNGIVGTWVARRARQASDAALVKQEPAKSDAAKKESARA